MNRQEFIQRIVGMFESGEPGLDIEIWQDRPNTAVNLTYHADDAIIADILGFSKVNWPDDWDEAEGIYLALRKAAANLWKSLYKNT